MEINGLKKQYMALWYIMLCVFFDVRAIVCQDDHAMLINIYFGVVTVIKSYCKDIFLEVMYSSNEKTYYPENRNLF